jgi:hypothetical protein
MSLGLTVFKEVELDLFLKDFPELSAEKIEEDIYKINSLEGSLITYLKDGKVNCFEGRVKQTDFSIFERYVNKYESNFVDDESLIQMSYGENVDVEAVMKKYGMKYFN